jgi:hypothetical protein
LLVAGSFVNSLGSTIKLPDAEGPEQPQIRPMTPGKPPKVDLDRVRQNLHELWVTEESYLRKIKSLLRVSRRILTSWVVALLTLYVGLCCTSSNLFAETRNCHYSSIRSLAPFHQH